jgi:type II secretory pathway component GspD/PulD (secretin)
MKRTFCILTLVGLVACALAGWAQNNSSEKAPPASANSAATEKAGQPEAVNENTPAAEPTVTKVADPAVTGAAPASSASKNAQTPAGPASTGVASPAVRNPVVAVNEVPQAPTLAANDTAPAVASTNAPQPGAVIPLIVMDDVPLTDAIKNLARQAGLNYMLDPKVGFGQPSPDGKGVVPQPSVSIRWENVTAEQALTALLKTYNLQLVQDPKTKIDLVTTKDPAAPDPLVTRIVQLKYANPSNILSSVQTVLVDKRSKVMPDVRTSQLVVLATDKEQDSVVAMVEKLDTITKQVLIEARLLETSMNPSTIKGMDWSGTLQAQGLHFGNNLQRAPVKADASDNAPLSSAWPKMMFDTAKGFNPATAFLDADGVNAVFSFLNNNHESKVISAPRTVTLDNETAFITVTRAEPIFKNTAGTQGSPGGSEVTYTNLGIILNVTPRISANNFVNLRIVPEVSRKAGTVTKTVAGTINQADEFDIRKVDTHVLVPSGNTLVLAGLVQDDVEKQNTKVPVLGDAPLLGWLFRSDSKSRTKSNLLIFITPTIVQDEDYQITPSDFLKTPVPVEDAVDGDWSAWDSGKPLDWSKPAFEKDKTVTHSDTNK